MNNVIDKLMNIGFSEYEAKAYLALLSRQPATAYEIAKASGLPSSKIYAVLGKLIDKGIVSHMEQGKTRQYVPLDPDEFLDRYKSVTDQLVDALKSDLHAFQEKEDTSHIWNITEYGYLIDKGCRMIQEASGTLLLSIWKEEMSLWEADLKQAVRRGVKVAIVHFGPAVSAVRQLYEHPIEDTIYNEKGGRGIAVIADTREVLIGTVFSGNKVEGAWSANRGFVTLAEDYIKHDIYIMKIVGRLDKTLVRRFGPGYVKLREIYKDEEWSENKP